MMRHRHRSAAVDEVVLRRNRRKLKDPFEGARRGFGEEIRGNDATDNLNSLPGERRRRRYELGDIELELRFAELVRDAGVIGGKVTPHPCCSVAKDGWLVRPK